MPHANDNRPAEFDRLIVKYLPGLRKLAAKLRPASPMDERDELVQSTVLKAIENWHKYRDGASPFPWLKLLMRGINRNALDRAALERRTAARMVGAEFQATLPNQEHVTDVSLVLLQIAPSLRNDFIQIGMGEACQALAPARGVTKQRMDQIVKAERARLASLERRAEVRRALAA